jgi:integrase
MYNQAVNAGVISYSHYPFRAYRIKKAPTVPHPISREEIIRYFRMDLSAQHKYYDSWLLGKLIFLLAGINVADLFQLTEENIKHGRVIYIRSKTKRVISIKLLPEAERIIQHFQRPGAKTLCGVLSEQELENRVKLPYVICQKGKNLNKHLTAIGKLINSASRIRSYTFRYTIANLCKQMGYDVQLISELLGHRYGSNTTSIYLQAYDHDLLDKMHVHVCKAVLAGG